MARNELFGIDVEEKEVKFDERVEKKEEKTKIGEVRISNKLTFKTGDDAEIKEFLKKVIDTKDYDEELKLIVNEWIERKIEKTGECAADEILFAHRYKNNLEGHDKDTLQTKTRSGYSNEMVMTNDTTVCLTNNLFSNNNGVIKKIKGKVPIWALIPKISLERIDRGLVLEIKATKSEFNRMNGGIGGLFTGGYYDYKLNGTYFEFIKFKFITKDDINKLLNDLLKMTKLVITERNSNNNVVDDFFG